MIKCGICNEAFHSEDRIYYFQRKPFNEEYPVTEYVLCEECYDEIYNFARDLEIDKRHEKDNGEERALNAMENGIALGENSFGDD